MAENCKNILSKLGEVREQTQKYNPTMSIQLDKTIGGQVAKMLEALSRQKC